MDIFSSLFNWSNRVLAQARNNFLFIPASFAFFTYLFFSFILFIDLQYTSSIKQFIPFIFTDYETVRTLLSVISGSVITVAGVTFSITLLTVVHASSQIGPRLLSGFMENTINQFTLGIFLMTFCHGILALSIIDENSIEILGTTLSGMPQLTIYLTILYSIMSVFCFVYFVHQIPKSIRMTHVISHLGEELREVTNNYFKKFQRTSANIKPPLIGPAETFSRQIGLESQATGYIQIINFKRLLSFCEKHNYFLEISKNPGDFVVKNQPILILSSNKKVPVEKTLQILSEFAIGEEKSVKQDFSFGAHILVEIAMRALSPGVNDPYTACECMDQLKAGLLTLARVEHSNDRLYDESGKLRILRPSFEFEEFVTDLLKPLIFYAAKDPLASKHLRKRLTELTQNPRLTDDHKMTFVTLKARLEKGVAKRQ